MKNKNCPNCGKALTDNALQGLCPECLMKAGWPTAPSADGQGHDFTPPELSELAELFPQLEILEQIGKGGMGAVYKARQPELDRLVALKILIPKDPHDPGFAERFTREARALARLSHPNIVAVYDFGHIDEMHYFIMEYVDGPNLRDIEKAGEMSPRDALQIIPQICEALQFAHDEGIVHRDIKPENILLDRKGRVKIADFGLAKILGHEPQDLHLTLPGHVMGTPHYMAPEQVEHPQDVDHRADIYSLGVVFYEMLTGELPMGKFKPPSQKVEVDVRLDEIVLRTLAKEPELRYQQVSQVQTEVKTITNTPPVTTQTDNSFKTEKEKSGYIRIIEIWSGTPFTSPLAIKLINISSLGFLAFLAFLSFAPLPGMQICKAFSGFAGFFGLIGLAFVAEFWGQYKKNRDNENATPQQRQSLKHRFILSLIPILLLLLIAGMIAVTTIVSFIQGKPTFVDATPLTSNAKPPFVAQLPQGTVELMGISEYPSEGKDWWAPDGSPALEGPFFIQQPLEANKVNSFPDREFVVHTKGLPTGASSPVFQINPCIAYATTSVALANGNVSPDLYGLTATVPQGTSKVQIKVGVAMGEWITGKINASSYINSDLSSLKHHENAFEISLKLSKTDQDYRIEYSYTLDSNYQMRIVPYTDQGTAVTDQNASDLHTATNNAPMTYYGEVRDQVPMLKYQYRPYYWVEFNDVALYPQSESGQIEKSSGFDSTIELTLHCGPELINCFVDLDRGRVLSAPPYLTHLLKANNQLNHGHVQISLIQDWIRQNDVDLFFRAPNGLTLIDGVSIGTQQDPLQANRLWATQTANDVLNFSQNVVHDILPSISTTEPLLQTIRTDETHAFRLASGRAGLIQIIDSNPDTGYMRIRYKLASQSSTDQSHSAKEDTQDLNSPNFGPQQEVVLQIVGKEDTAATPPVFLDLDSGQTLLITEETKSLSMEEMMEWMAGQGMDLFLRERIAYGTLEFDPNNPNHPNKILQIVTPKANELKLAILPKGTRPDLSPEDLKVLSDTWGSDDHYAREYALAEFQLP